MDIVTDVQTAIALKSGTSLKKMLKAIRLPYLEDKTSWSISPYTGSLIRHNKKLPDLLLETPGHIVEALKVCSDPYLCKWDSSPPANQVRPEIRCRLELINSRLHFLGNKRFFFSVLYSGISVPLFENTREAFCEIATLPEQVNNRAELCLQRSLLSVKTSNSFKKNKGVLFIGASLSSAEMHAWIIEEGAQPDFQDRTWINFRPLLAYSHF